MERMFWIFAGVATLAWRDRYMRLGGTDFSPFACAVLWLSVSSVLGVYTLLSARELLREFREAGETSTRKVRALFTVQWLVGLSFLEFAVAGYFLAKTMEQTLLWTAGFLILAAIAASARSTIRRACPLTLLSQDEWQGRPKIGGDDGLD